MAKEMTGAIAEETSDEKKRKRVKPLKATADHSLTRKGDPKKKNKTERWQLDAAEKYLKEHEIESIRIRMGKEDKEKIRLAAEESGKSMNEFILKIVMEAISK